MTKVAYIISLRDSLESFIHREISCLQQKGVDIVAYSFFKDKGGLYSPSSMIPIFTVNPFGAIFAIFSEFMRSPRGYVKLLLHAIKFGSVYEFIIGSYFAKVTRKNGVDTIQCHFGDRKYFAGYYCKKLTGVRLNLTVHAHEIFANPNEKLFSAIVNETDKIVAISEKNKQLLIDKCGANPEIIEVIRLSIDLENFKKSDDVYFLTVARYTERKGFRELFHAISLLPELEGIKFVTVGWGTLDLHALAVEYKVSDKVIIFDKMNPEQLRFFYNKCDVFCLPSKATKEEGEEGIPVVLMEAMASEMLVLTTNNGSICELVDEIVVEQGSVDELKVGIEKAYLKVKANDFDGKSSRGKVLEHYSADNIEKLYEYLYEN